MKNSPLVSIIMPVYNTEKYVKQAIQSVLGQTYGDIELILIDDGSSDLSGAICDEYAAMDSRIVVIHQENRGVSAARNRGLEIAGGEYIQFIDSDDALELECTEKLLNAILGNNVELVIGGCYFSNA